MRVGLIFFGCLVVCATLRADPITGTIVIQGSAAMDDSPGYAHTVLNWPVTIGCFGPSIGSETGTFTNIPIGIGPSMSRPWNFKTTSPIQGFWYDAGFQFNLISSSVSLQSTDFGSVSVTGVGTITKTGYSTTAATWSFFANDTTYNGTSYCFGSTTTAIPTPSLSFAQTNGSILISWTTNSSNFKLQQSFSPKGTNWTTVTTVPGITNGQKSVAFPIIAGSNQFFRLSFP